MLWHKNQGAGGQSGSATGWDLTNLAFNGGGYGTLSLAGVESNPEDVWINEVNGTDFYVLGGATNTIRQFTLSTPYVLSTASSVRTENLNIGSSAKGLYFRSGGASMYISGGDFVYQYSLSTAWDVSTLSLVRSVDLSADVGTARGVFFKPDGTAMYVVSTSPGAILEYTLSTAWNISTASLRVTLTTSKTYYDIFFKSDGTQYYLAEDAASGSVLETATLGTAWDLSTSTSPSDTLIVAGRCEDIRGIYIRSDGAKLFISNSTPDAVNAYDVGTVWNLSTSVWDGPATDYYYVGGSTSLPTNLTFKTDGTKMYAVGILPSSAMFEYDLSSAWELSTASLVDTESLAAQDSTPQAIALSSDGTKLYIAGLQNGSIYQYSLTTPWEIGVRTLTGSFSYTSQDSNVKGISFNSNGSTMYLTGASNDTIYKYTLSTPGDVTTATYASQSLLVSGQTTSPTGIGANPGLSRLVIATETSAVLYQYDAPSPGALSSATFTQSKTLPTTQRDLKGVAFKNDGEKVFVISGTLDAAEIWAYEL